MFSKKPKNKISLIDRLLGGEGKQANGVVTISPEKYFYFSGGRFVKNVPELVTLIPSLTESEWAGYVNQAQNHFANWIEFVFLNKTLANHLRAVQSREETLAVLTKAIKRK